MELFVRFRYRYRYCQRQSFGVRVRICVVLEFVKRHLLDERNRHRLGRR